MQLLKVTAQATAVMYSTSRPSQIAARTLAPTGPDNRLTCMQFMCKLLVHGHVLCARLDVRYMQIYAGFYTSENVPFHARFITVATRSLLHYIYRCNNSNTALDSIIKQAKPVPMKSAGKCMYNWKETSFMFKYHKPTLYTSEF